MHASSLARTLAVAVVVLAANGPMAAASGSSGWRWPVRGPVLTHFEVGFDRFAPGQRRGITIGAPIGTAVRSACSGSVSFAGSVASAGQTVSVACSDGLTATYLHLGEISVGRGQRLAVGQPIATVGASGQPQLIEPHLQFGVHRTGEPWSYLDPLSLLDQQFTEPSPVGSIPVERPNLPAITLAPSSPHMPGAALTPAATPLPTVVWIGAALLILALPGWGVSHLTRRTKRSARAARDAHRERRAPII